MKRIGHGTIRNAKLVENHALERACNNTSWLKPGGYAEWANYNLKDKPYVIFETNDAKVLEKFLVKELQDFRTGIIYEEFAFVQQIDKGDEWLVLKKVNEDTQSPLVWFPFESVSFRAEKSYWDILSQLKGERK